MAGIEAPGLSGDPVIQLTLPLGLDVAENVFVQLDMHVHRNAVVLHLGILSPAAAAQPPLDRV